jgi:hypothetical protein
MQKSNSDQKELNHLKREFALWRNKKANARTQIPERLWAQAAHLSETYSVGRICAELGLDHRKLKEKAAKRRARSTQPSFVSVELPGVKNTGSIYEWIRPDGARLRVRMEAGTLDEVVCMFLRGER